MFGARLICSWIGAFGLAAGAFGQTYVQILVDESTFPNSINEKGDIAGYYYDFAGVTRGFVRSAEGGTITSFDVPGPTVVGTIASSINAVGAITGYYVDTMLDIQRYHGFIRDPEGNFTTFDPPGSYLTRVVRITAGGATVGTYSDGIGISHAFVREPNGTITPFDPPGSISTTPDGINPEGTIAGYYEREDLSLHGFVRQPNGTIVSFDPPGSTGTIVTGINYAGTITGYYTVRVTNVPGRAARTVGFARDPDGMFTFFDPDFFTSTSSINNEGAITGEYTEVSGTIGHDFVRTPGGSITIFDLPTTLGCSDPSITRPAQPTSMNDKGVITGFCRSPNFVPTLGWVRFP
jgi:hypothetical protein